MRIALVLHDASPEPDGAPLFPTVALERDGALYRVSALARAFGPRYAALDACDDFRHAVLSTGAEPLYELDERLKAGERPTSARILPGTFTWLPPCDPERAALVLCTPHADAVYTTPPAFHLASARPLLGHDAAVPVAPFAARASGALDAEAMLAVILGDDLSRATASEADRAILGYTLLLAWRPGLAAQLGPVLVTRDEAGDVRSLRTLLRVGGATLPTAEACASPFTPAEAIAWISHHLPLQAGDVIGAGRVRGGSASDAGAKLTAGMRVDFAIERLGRLCGRPVDGPEPRAWRRS
jgi:hypothetical protein